MELQKNPSEFPENESHFLIDGPSGNLECLTQAAPSVKGVAILCHPHPQHLGTMNNKVVYTLARSFSEKGLHTIRFNFRGVGKSEGEYGDSIGETQDLMAVIAWAEKVLPNTPLWLAGFSFGAYIAANGVQVKNPQQLFSIAPSVERQPYATLEITCPWIIVQGENDEVVSPDAVYDWVEQYEQTHTNVKLIKMPETSHFFHGKLTDLRNILSNEIIV